MMAYVKHRMREKVFRWTTLYKCFGYFLLCFVVVHLDLVGDMVKQQDMSYSLQVDASADECLGLLGCVPLYDASLTYLSKGEDGWILHVKQEVDDAYVSWVNGLLLEYEYGEEYTIMMEKINNPHLTIEFEKSSSIATMIQILVTFFFFLMIMKSINMVHEWIEERQNRFTDVLVQSMGYPCHLYAKTLSSFTDGLFDVLLMVLCLVVCITLKWFEGGLDKWLEMLVQNRWLVLDLLLWCKGHLFVCVLALSNVSISVFLLQMVGVAVLSVVKETIHVTSFTLPVYLSVLIVYYGSTCVPFDGVLFKILCWLPGFSGVCFSYYCIEFSYLVLSLGLLCNVMYLVLFAYVGGIVYRKWMIE